MLESPCVLALGSVAVGIVISPLMDQQVTHSVGVIPVPINVYCIGHYLLSVGVSALRVTSNEEYPSACEGKYCVGMKCIFHCMRVHI